MRTMPRLLLLLICMSMVTMMFIARCGLNMDSQLHSSHHNGLPTSSNGSPGEKALREVMRRKEVEHTRDKSALQEKIRSLESELRKVQRQVVNMTANVHYPPGQRSRADNLVERDTDHANMGFQQGARDGSFLYGAGDRGGANGAGNKGYHPGGKSNQGHPALARNGNYDARGGGGVPNNFFSNPAYPEVGRKDDMPIVAPLELQKQVDVLAAVEHANKARAGGYDQTRAGADRLGGRWENDAPQALMRNGGGGVNSRDLKAGGMNFVGGTGNGNSLPLAERAVVDRHALGMMDEEDSIRNGGGVLGVNPRLSGNMASSLTAGARNVAAQLDGAAGERGWLQGEKSPGYVLQGKSFLGGTGDSNVTREVIDYEKYIQERLKAAEILKGQPYKTEYELIPFNRFIFNRIFMVDPGLGKRVVEKPIGFKKKDLNEAIYHAVESLNENRSGNSLYTHEDFVEGVYRTNPSSGSHYEMYFVNKDDRGVKHPNSYVKISVLRPFAPLRTVQRRLVTTGEAWINVILPLSGRLDTFRIFMDQFIKTCIKQDRRVYLTVVYFGDEGLKEVKTIMGKVAKAHRFKHMKLVTLNEPFARGRGLQIGALNWKGGDVLLFFCDVDIVFTTEFLERCRLNSEQGQRVYYPIVFSLYNPNIVYSLQDVKMPSFQDQLVLSKDTGFWRDFGYGMTCQFRSDFLNIKGFDEQITGWGGEDVFLYQKFVRNEHYFVIRATDPAIFHLWHEKYCEPTLTAEQYRSCIRSKALNEASHAQLGLLAFKDEIDVHRSVSATNGDVPRSDKDAGGKNQDKVDFEQV